MKSFERKKNKSRKTDAQPLYGRQNKCYRVVDLIAIMYGFSYGNTVHLEFAHAALFAT